MQTFVICYLFSLKSLSIYLRLIFFMISLNCMKFEVNLITIIRSPQKYFKNYFNLKKH